MRSDEFRRFFVVRERETREEDREQETERLDK